MMTTMTRDDDGVGGLSSNVVMMTKTVAGDGPSSNILTTTTTAMAPEEDGGREDVRTAGMVQAWVDKKLVNVTFYEFLRCPFFALGLRFHKNRDILEVVYYNVKLLY
jgi:hypothetical protein